MLLCQSLPAKRCGLKLCAVFFFGGPSMGLTLHENPNTKKHKAIKYISIIYIYIYKHIHQYTSWRGEGKNLLPCSVRKSTLNSQISFTKNISSADCLFHRFLRPTWFLTVESLVMALDQLGAQRIRLLQKIPEIGRRFFSKLVSKLPETNSKST